MWSTSPWKVRVYDLPKRHILQNGAFLLQSLVIYLVQQFDLPTLFSLFLSFFFLCSLFVFVSLFSVKFSFCCQDFMFTRKIYLLGELKSTKETRKTNKEKLKIKYKSKENKINKNVFWGRLFYSIFLSQLGIHFAKPLLQNRSKI